MQTVAINRVRILVAMATTAMLFLSDSHGVASAASACQSNPYHWYASATAPTGAGTADGSNIAEMMPKTYYTGANTTTDEAAWVVNGYWANQNASPTNNYAHNGGFELGWFQGVWPYSASYVYYSSPHAYMTSFNGTYGAILNSTALPKNGDLIYFQLGWVDTLCNDNRVWDAQTGVNYYQSSTCSTSTSSEVPTPRFNYSQGEVASSVAGDNQGSWMGGNSGSGIVTLAQYQSASDHSYHNWGSYSTCSDLPYWITGNTAGNTWINGGP